MCDVFKFLRKMTAVLVLYGAVLKKRNKNCELNIKNVSFVLQFIKNGIERIERCAHGKCTVLRRSNEMFNGAIEPDAHSISKSHVARASKSNGSSISDGTKLSTSADGTANGTAANVSYGATDSCTSSGFTIASK